MRVLSALLWLGVLLVLPCEPSLCADAGPLAISVPEGFEGPTRTDEAGGVAIGWVKRLPGKEGGTVLQVSAVDVGTSVDGITAAQRAEATRHYLLEFIAGIQLRRKDFELGDIEQVSLAGLPAVRVRWTGAVDDIAAIGVMYCVLVGHWVVSLHTQDVGFVITPSMYSAMSAIESVRVR